MYVQDVPIGQEIVGSCSNLIRVCMNLQRCCESEIILEHPIWHRQLVLTRVVCCTCSLIWSHVPPRHVLDDNYVVEPEVGLLMRYSSSQEIMPESYKHWNRAWDAIRVFLCTMRSGMCQALCLTTHSVMQFWHLPRGSHYVPETGTDNTLPLQRGHVCSWEYPGHRQCCRSCNGSTTKWTINIEIQQCRPSKYVSHMSKIRRRRPLFFIIGDCHRQTVFLGLLLLTDRRQKLQYCYEHGTTSYNEPPTLV